MKAILCWGAHAPRVLVSAASPKRTFPFDRADKLMPARAPALGRRGDRSPKTPWSVVGGQLSEVPK